MIHQTGYVSEVRETSSVILITGFIIHYHLNKIKNNVMINFIVSHIKMDKGRNVHMIFGGNWSPFSDI